MTNREAIKVIIDDSLYNPEVAQLAIQALNQSDKIKIGEAIIKSCGRSYNECNVCDFVSILIANGYEVRIKRPSQDNYHVEYYR